MPRISSFYGIVISMYFDDHEPPHFHATYGEFRARWLIDSNDILDGELPPRAFRLVREWTGLHQDELRENWERARHKDALVTIDPLP